jgi:hypothetical protein
VENELLSAEASLAQEESLLNRLKKSSDDPHAVSVIRPDQLLTELLSQLSAPAAVMNAINDALRPFGAKVFAQPFTPERILAALGKVPERDLGSSQVRIATTPIGTAPVAADATASQPRSGNLLDRLLGRQKT